MATANPADAGAPAVPAVPAAARRSGPDRRWVWIVVGVAAVLPLMRYVAPEMMSDYRLFLISTMMIASIAVLGLNLLTGFNGQISLGHGAFYAVGAYTAAILMDKLNAPYWTLLPVVFVVCFVVGFLFGLPALRLEGHYLALATFALALAVPQMLKYRWLEGLTGGVQGIVLSKPESPHLDITIFGRHLDLKLSEDQWLYYYILAVMVLLYWAAWNMLQGRSGRAMMAIRDHHMAADTMGINTARYKTVTFGISAAYTGIAGALSASTIAFVAPDSFGFFLSISLLIGLVVGGIASLSGSVIGGVFTVLVPNLAQALSKLVKNDMEPWLADKLPALAKYLSALLEVLSNPYFVYGVLLIVLVYTMPTGIAGGIVTAWRRMRR